MNKIYSTDLQTKEERFATKEETHTLFEDGRAVTSKVYEVEKGKFSFKKEELDWIRIK